MVSVQSEYQLDANVLSEAWKAENWLNFNENSVITAVKNGENEEQNALEISQLLAKSEQEVQFWTVADEQRFSLAFLAAKLLKLVLAY